MQSPGLVFGLLLATLGTLAAKDPVPTTSSPINTQPGSYCSFVRQGDDLYIFSEQVAKGKPNASGKICPGINLYKASGKNLTRSNFEKTVAPNELINDLFSAPNELDPNRLLTRLGVQFSPKDQKFHAIAYVSRGYPSADGIVVPAMFASQTADPKGDWTYLGKITLDGGPVKFFGSGGNLLLNDQPAAEVDHRNPLANKFVHYTDNGPALSLIYSNDGAQWYTYKDAQGVPVNLRPPEFKDEKGWIFPSVVRTKNDGYFMAATVGWPPEGHHFLHSDDGLTWKIIGDGHLETNVGGLPEAKNISLGYDEKTDTIYLLITRTGSDHFKNVADVRPKDLADGVQKDEPAGGEKRK